VYEYLANVVFFPECRLWYWKIVEGLAGISPDPAALTEWVNNLPAEEKALARLLVARVYPDTVHMDWLHEVPADCPAIAFQLARIAALKPERANAVNNFLRERPLVRNQSYN
jgi:hypothetical protein